MINVGVQFMGRGVCAGWVRTEEYEMAVEMSLSGEGLAGSMVREGRVMSISRGILRKEEW